MTPEKLAAMMELSGLNHTSLAVLRKTDEILDKLIEILSLEANLIAELKKINNVVMDSESSNREDIT